MDKTVLQVVIVRVLIKNLQMVLLILKNVIVTQVVLIVKVAVQKMTAQNVRIIAYILTKVAVIKENVNHVQHAKEMIGSVWKQQIKMAMIQMDIN